mgnify:CR=1 FL=1
MKIIDAHCHVYPQAIAAKAVANIGSFYDVAMYGSGTAENLLASGINCGIAQYLIFSVATTPHQTKSINEFIAKVASENPQMKGLGTIHPDSNDILGEINHLKELGLLGLKMHHDFQNTPADDPQCMKIYEICAAKHLPVLLHTGDKRYDYSNPNRIKNILRAFPDLTLIGAHFGGWSIWDKAPRELAEYPNFYVDSSSSFYALNPQTAREIIYAYGSERILFGSDYPMWNAANDLNYLLSLGLAPAELENIFHRTAEKLFNL